jgi:hypothetical protein
MPLLSSILAFPDWEDDVLSHDPCPPPDGAGSPRLRERHAYWQVGISIARMFKLCKESCLRAAGFSSPACKDWGFQTRSLVIYCPLRAILRRLAASFLFRLTLGFS